MNESGFFQINNPLLLIQSEVDRLLASGLSYRDIAKDCGFKSSNYIQMLLSGKRRLTLDVTKNLIKGLKLTGDKKEFLALLVKQNLLTGKPLQAVKEKLSNLRGQAEHIKISDQSLYDAWYHSVIYEMSALKDFTDDPAAIAKRLGGQVTVQDVQGSLKFLQDKGWLVKDQATDGYQRKAIHFSGGNKNRNIKMQLMHKRFLEMAIHRLNDELEERIYQAMTIAIPRSKFEVVRSMMRNFIDDLEKELTVADPSDEIIRIQCCAFKITR